jgi:hypothetical protein
MRPHGRTIALVALGLLCGPAAAAEIRPSPAPPLPPSPVAFFRQLLATNEQARARALSVCPDQQRASLQAKLEEYHALPRTERNRRLQATELRWYLRTLIARPETNRTAELAAVPHDLRELVETQLARWDALPRPTRDQLLAYDEALSWLARTPSARTNLTARAQPPSPPGLGDRIESELAHYRLLPESRRHELLQQFEAFFVLPPTAREKTLGNFSAEDRKLMEETLHAFAQLPPEQRKLCLASFRRFADLSPAERADFLRSADRWREMSPAEREQWRQLVTRLPPLPPGFSSPPMLPPPLPARVADRR